MAGFITGAGASYLMGLAAKSEYTVSNYYVALTTAVPAPLDTAADLVEVDDPDYYRAQIPVDPSFWSLELNRLANALEISFPVATNGWDGIRGWALLDDPNNGRVLFGGSLAITWTIPAGYQVTMSPGMLTVAIEVANWVEEQ